MIVNPQGQNRARRPTHGMMGPSDLAKHGRGGDTRMAHVTPGEMIVPREVAAMRPELVEHVRSAIAQSGGDPRRYTVGAGRVNPQTGVEEFATEDEVKAAYAAQVEGLYGQYGKTPDLIDQEGMDFWTGKLAQGENITPAFRQSATDVYQGQNAQSPYADQNQQGMQAWTGNLDQGAIDYYGNLGVGSNAVWDAMAPEIRAGIASGNLDTNTLTPEMRGSIPSAGALWGGGDDNHPNGVYPGPYNPNYEASKDPRFAPNLNQGVSADATIQGRLNSMLSTDERGNYTDPVIRQAVDRAMQTFAARGLLNSSIAVQAAQEAAISKAIEIVGPDAERFFQQSRANQDAQNVFARDEVQQGYTVANNIAKWAQEDKSQASDQAFRLQVLSKEQSFTLRQNYMEAQDAAAARYNSTVNNINASNMTPEDKSIAIAQAATVRDGDIAYNNKLFAAQPDFAREWLAQAVPLSGVDVGSITNIDTLSNIANDPAQPQAIRNAARQRIAQLRASPAAPAASPAAAPAPATDGGNP